MLKYRPQTFKDLIGHEEIARITNKNEHQLMLSIYWHKRNWKDYICKDCRESFDCDMKLKACENKCNNCVSIANSNHIDVLEMDIRQDGVDDVRELIEFSRYPPNSKV